MITFNDEERQRLKSGKAIDVTDSETDEHYVVLGKEIYERIRHLLYDDSEWSTEELRLHLARSSKENGWEEPGMDAYDRYDEEVNKRLLLSAAT
jgi:hypothetical protein